MRFPHACPCTRKQNSSTLLRAPFRDDTPKVSLKRRRIGLCLSRTSLCRPLQQIGRLFPERAEPTLAQGGSDSPTSVLFQRLFSDVLARSPPGTSQLSPL